jgi:hypothetical protein
MSEPRTAAGRRILRQDYRGNEAYTVMRQDILAIESEAFMDGARASRENRAAIESEAAALPASPDVVEALRGLLGRRDSDTGDLWLHRDDADEAFRLLDVVTGAAPAGLDVERLGMLLFAEDHGRGWEWWWENGPLERRKRFVARAEAIAAAYAEGEPTE